MKKEEGRILNNNNNNNNILGINYIILLHFEIKGKQHE